MNYDKIYQNFLLKFHSPKINHLKIKLFILSIKILTIYKLYLYKKSLIFIKILNSQIIFIKYIDLVDLFLNLKISFFFSFISSPVSKEF